MSSLTRNHFDLFGLPAAFRLDRAALDSAYRAVQGTVHPDRYAAGSDTDRRLAMQLAAQANEAYRTLRDPALRAGYLCALRGVDVGIESNTALPADFLMQQMEWRERLDDATDGRDVPALESLRDELAEQRDALLRELAAAIDERGDFAEAAGLVRRLMFLDRFASGIDAAEERLLQH
jgi:molecular chaperone HscB